MRTGVLVKDRRVAAFAPTASHRGRHQQPGFVEENQIGVQARINYACGHSKATCYGTILLGWQKDLTAYNLRKRKERMRTT